ncbi:MAG: hypothetical protein HKN11_11850 [Rhizobiales bacterium]|nr:hypothetical protein [Hyphomicrobiales bacterium]
MFDKEDAEIAFRGLSASAIETLPPAQSFALMFDFYETVRAKDAAPQDEDGDMLLFQWGIYNWRKHDSDDAGQFELNLSRQVIYPDGDDQEIYQLGLTYSYQPDDVLEALGKGNFWCHDLSIAHEARTKVLTSPALVHCDARTAVSVSLDWQQQ